MQSDGNSFCGDIVFDIFNMAYRDKYNILDQKYDKCKYANIVLDLYYKNPKVYACIYLV